MTCEDIIKAYLIANGYDGLCHPDTECGCFVSDDENTFCVCGGLLLDCIPAYKIDLPPDDPRGGWWMVTRKPTSEKPK